MQALPVWRTAPEPVLIKVTILGESAWPDKVLAGFQADGREYALIADAVYVDQEGQKMGALIVADVGDDGFLVELPGESPSVGSRVFARKVDVEPMKSGVSQV